MKFLWFDIETKKELRQELKEMNRLYDELRNSKREVLSENQTLIYALDNLNQEFPFRLDDIVYDLELRSSKGRYTKKNPSIEHSLINEVEVKKNNYFNLVEKFNNKEVFKSLKDAETQLRSICGVTDTE